MITIRGDSPKDDICRLRILSYRALVFLDSTSDFINRRPQAKTLLLELASLHDVSKQNSLSLAASRSCAETRFRQSSPDAAAVTSELRLTALPRVERFPNLKSTPSNGMTTTTIDEKK
ncbi:hypothetical protein J6590_068839 [Homalodisca vitripennis]|nr:hypothetical protein J6590_068839 [Homalodisca vitripennis]